MKQLAGVAEMNVYALRALGSVAETVDVSGGYGRSDKRAAQAPPPIPQPEKITVSATVQCAFQIQ